MPIDVVCALHPSSRGHELKRRLEPNKVLVADSASRLDSLLRAGTTDMVIAGTRVPTPPIEDWIREVRDLPESPDVVLVHDRDDAEFRAAAVRAGCLAVLGNLSIDELAEKIETLIAQRPDLIGLAQAAPAGHASRLRDFVSLSPRMQEFLALARQVVSTDSSLLLLGETGTGKERLARALHQEGQRSAHPFVAVNCGALPENLVESELFGHEKGAFTGSVRMHRGYFEQADGGTLFLDEIAELPPPLQVKLLRVLEDRRVQRVGAESSFPVDLRLVAATNRNLEREVAGGRFREDLFYRVAVVTLEMPPLRERTEDIPALFERYLNSFRQAFNRPIFGVAEEALQALTRYRWPGNVRELINVAERAVLLSPGPEIGLSNLPRAISALAPAATASSPAADTRPPWLDQRFLDAREQVVRDFESRYLGHLLRVTGGRIGEAARQAGLNERSLFELMRRHGLRKEDFRADLQD